MTPLKKSILLLSLLIHSIIFSQSGNVTPKYSNEFLTIGVGADALGLGNAVVAQTGGVYAGFWNPAGLTQTTKKIDVGLMHSDYFAGIAKYDYLGIAHRINSNSAIGFSAIRFAVDNILNTTQLIDNSGNVNYDNIKTFAAADYGFLVSYARKLKKEGLSLGGSFKLIHRKIGDFAHSWGFGLDAGLQYTTKNEWKFGFMAKDVSSTFNAWVFTLDQQTKDVFTATGNAIPRNGIELTLPRFIAAGYHSFKLGKKGLYTSTELDLDITTDGMRNTLIKSGLFSVDPHFGLEIGYKKIVRVRGGVNSLQYAKDFKGTKQLSVQPNIGIGLTIKNFQLDYAFTHIGDASVALYSHIISLRIQLANPTKKSGS